MLAPVGNETAPADRPGRRWSVVTSGLPVAAERLLDLRVAGGHPRAVSVLGVAAVQGGDRLRDPADAAVAEQHVHHPGVAALNHPPVALVRERPDLQAVPG